MTDIRPETAQAIEAAASRWASEVLCEQDIRPYSERVRLKQQITEAIESVVRAEKHQLEQENAEVKHERDCATAAAQATTVYNQRLERENAELRAVLQSVEWEDRRGGQHCPSCGKARFGDGERNQHHANCALATALSQET